MPNLIVGPAPYKYALASRSTLTSSKGETLLSISAHRASFPTFPHFLIIFTNTDYLSHSVIVNKLHGYS